ncbi:Mitochondrial dicarboxylate/tricarboxylate transporter DTC [Vitis vinifera]|uniref:Mitochondrial dicarboxylate/tricarboxylate transporter DTC n=1 Tax=Vitis vinifera TaxID=29760 RepID=A0A438FI58_VITVI|nr:Mitochondrial dicarboxylate/tricarboxylate transporter DTC [Vitis vinifera]
MALNMEMLASYDQSVEFFKDFLIWVKLVLGCNLMPVEVSVHSSLDRAMKTLKYGGPLKFHIGFPVHCVRIAPYVMLTWIFLLEPNLEVGRIHGVVNLINAKKC